MNATYMLWVRRNGNVRMVIDDGRWTGSWTYESWESLLATQTFSPYARVFVYSSEMREGA